VETHETWVHHWPAAPEGTSKVSKDAPRAVELASFRDGSQKTVFLSSALLVGMKSPSLV
jgi:hypothetical protein